MWIIGAICGIAMSLVNMLRLWQASEKIRAACGGKFGSSSNSSGAAAVSAAAPAMIQGVQCCGLDVFALA